MSPDGRGKGDVDVLHSGPSTVPDAHRCPQSPSRARWASTSVEQEPAVAVRAIRQVIHLGRSP